MSKLTFKIDGMCCVEEMAALKNALNPLLKDKQDRLTFDLISEKITIEQDSNLPTEDEIVKAVRTTGMKATPWKIHVDKRQPSQTLWQLHGQAIMAALSAAGLGAGFLAHSLENSAADALLGDEKAGNTYPPEVIAFYAASMLAGVWFILPKAFRSARKLRPDMNLLMTIAIGGAAGINQWFEAAVASTLFSSSLLLESWNINRARKSIRALVELSPSTAKVAENRISRPVTDKTYLRHPVMGDDGYAVFDVSREQALEQLIEAVDSIKAILAPAIKECLLRGDFYHYLKINNAIASDIAQEDILENINKYAVDNTIATAYLHYDVQAKYIDSGWAHPCVLQALAHIQQKELRMWQLNERGILIPHQGNETDYTVYIPTDTQEPIDILFIHGNHFERLEFCENDIEEASSSTYEPDVDMNQSIFIEKPVDEIPVDSIIIVNPGEKIPMDSILISGPTEVNQAPITGESMPVRKEIGDELFAGTINGDAVILCRVTKVAADSTLSRIINMVEAAQSRRASSEQFVEKFATYYTPLMMVVAALIFVILPTAFDRSWEKAFYQALEILVIACPCALVVSTPISIVAGLNAAARAGVLIKGGMYLEAPAHLKAIALDKTGTLTSGEPTVQKIISMDEQSQRDLLKLALALEEHSDHPLARAIRQKAKAEGIVSDKPVENFHIIKGKGAEAYLDGKLFWIGSQRFLREKMGDMAPIALYDEIHSLENTGHSIVAIGYEQHVCGLIGISDAVRPESNEAMQALHQLGIEKIIMLTGDNRGSAKAIAESVGIDDYQAELLPEDKVQHVESLVKKYQQVAMVGDGVNDAPAMATASLAIAMGAAGSDAAIETADIALMSDDLNKLPWLINHSRRTLGIIKQNVAISLTIKAVFISLAFADKATLGMAIAADMGASFIVVFNALRLLNNKLSVGWNVKNKAMPQLQQSQSTHYNDKRPLLLEQDMAELEEIELTVMQGKQLSSEEAKTSSAPKKPCSSSGNSCSKSKVSTLASINNSLPVLIQDTGEGIKPKLMVISGKNTFFGEQSVKPVVKKSCCSSDSCSKPKEQTPVVAHSQLIGSENINDKNDKQPLLLAPEPEFEDIKLTIVDEKNTSVETSKANLAPKKPCCSGSSCSKGKAVISNTVVSRDLPSLLAAPATVDMATPELTVINNKVTFFEGPKSNQAPKKSCCSSGNCSKSQEKMAVKNIEQPALLEQDIHDKMELKFA